MKNTFLILVCFLSLLSCGQQRGSHKEGVQAVADTQESVVVEDTTRRETLNDIRFSRWTKAEWADNEYIREVRRYIDAYNRGEIENSDLDGYRDYLQGQFVIGQISPYLMGGAFMYIVFLDHPDKTFSAAVYSDVDEDTRTVSNYDCRTLRYVDMDLGFSKEDILQFLKECPEQRLW